MISYARPFHYPLVVHARKRPAEPLPPLNIVNALMFAITMAVALMSCPGTDLPTDSPPLTGSWRCCSPSLNGIGHHGRLSPPVGAQDLRGALERCGCCCWCSAPWRCRTAPSIWCSGHRRHHLHVDDEDEDPYSARRGFWFSHIGWMLREYPSGKPDFSNIPDLKRDPMLAFQHRYYLPLLLLANFGLPLLAGPDLPRRARHDAAGRRRAAGVEPPRHLLHQLAGAHVGHAALHRGELGARQPGAGGVHLRRGLPQLPPHLRARLPQRRALVAVGPDQVVHQRPGATSASRGA